jgi:Fe-S cluster biogenesis protein NfuA
MDKVKKYVNVYTEANPNPNSLKFVVNYMLAPDGASFDFPSKESAAEVPLAEELFSTFDFVERVFIAANFITVTKSQEAQWEVIAREIKLHIQAYLEDDKPVFSQQFVSKNSIQIDINDSEAVKKIKGILDEYIRPAVETDGGAISFHSFDEASGLVKVLLQGSCSGCPSSTVTLKAGIENLLKRMVPEVREVVAEGM